MHALSLAFDSTESHRAQNITNKSHKHYVENVEDERGDQHTKIATLIFCCVVPSLARECVCGGCRWTFSNALARSHLTKHERKNFLPQRATA